MVSRRDLAPFQLNRAEASGAWWSEIAREEVARIAVDYLANVWPPKSESGFNHPSQAMSSFDFSTFFVK